MRLAVLKLRNIELYEGLRMNCRTGSADSDQTKSVVARFGLLELSQVGSDRLSELLVSLLKVANKVFKVENYPFSEAGHRLLEMLAGLLQICEGIGVPDRV